MVNELSRFGDQLPRARHRQSSHTASVLIAPPARREPTHIALARTADRELYAEDERSSRALVSIHVEVSHPQLEAEPIQARLEQIVEAYAESVAPSAPEREPTNLAALRDALPRSSESEAAPQLSSDAFRSYAADRGFGAYAAQGSFTPSRSASATRLLNVRA